LINQTTLLIIDTEIGIVWVMLICILAELVTSSTLVSSQCMTVEMTNHRQSSMQIMS